MGWFRNLGNDRPWAQGCVIAGAGAALATTSCFGFLLTLDMNSGTSQLAEVANVAIAVVFGLTALAIPIGCIWFIVGLVKGASKNRLPPPPAGPGD
jgi:hypothetical protein